MRNGKLPLLAKDWQWRKFGDCAQFINGRAYSQEELLDSGTPVLRIQNLNGGDRWYYSNLKLPDEKYCEAGDLLYAWSASFGPYRFNGPKSIFHYHIWRVIPGEGLDKGFAFRLLEQITNEVKSAAHGVAMLHMTKGGMDEWPVPLPPLAEQRRIAEVLDRAEGLRAKRRTALAQLDSLTQSLFLDLFGDPRSNPKHWKICTLSEVAEFFAGSTLPEGLEFSGQEGGYFLLKVSDMNLGGNETYLVNCQQWTSSPGAKACSCPSGSVVIPKRGGAIGTNKKRISTRASVLDPNLMAILPTSASLDLLFLFQWFLHLDLATITSGSSVPQLNKRDLALLRIPVPPIELQREFARQVCAVEKLKTAQRASLAELDSLFASLQHRAFRGEL